MIDINEIKAGRISKEEKAILSIINENIGDNMIYNLQNIIEHGDALIMYDNCGNLILKHFGCIVKFNIDYVHKYYNHASLITDAIIFIDCEKIRYSILNFTHDVAKQHISESDKMYIDKNMTLFEFIVRYND